jgi:hypothetical protein
VGERVRGEADSGAYTFPLMLTSGSNLSGLRTAQSNLCSIELMI